MKRKAQAYKATLSTGFMPPKLLPCSHHLENITVKIRFMRIFQYFCTKDVNFDIKGKREIIVFFCVVLTEHRLFRKVSVRDNAKYSSVFGLQSYGHLSSVFVYRMMGLCMTCA